MYASVTAAMAAGCSSRRSRRRRRRPRRARRSCGAPSACCAAWRSSSPAAACRCRGPRYFCGVSGSRSRNAVPVSCSAFTSSVSCTIRSAWCSPQAVTQAAQPLQRSDTKIEKTPPPPGLLLLGRREDRVGLLVRHRHLVDDVEELRLASGEKPLTSLVTFWMICGAAGGRSSPPVAHHLARALLDLRHQREHLLPLAASVDVVGDRASAGSSRDPASSWGAPCPDRPRCTPCTACSSPGCRAASRGGRRTSTRCRRCRPPSRRATRAARPAGCSRADRNSGVERRDPRQRGVRSSCPRGIGCDRQPEPHPSLAALLSGRRPAGAPGRAASTDRALRARRPGSRGPARTPAS